MADSGERAAAGGDQPAAQAAEGAQPGVAAAGPGQKTVSPLVLPSYAAACELVGIPHSCLALRTHRTHLALSPRYLSSKRSGLREQLSGQLLRYSSSLNGVPVAYDNIRIVGELGDIIDDAGFIHLNVEADYVVFQPEKGQKLVGVVNKVAPSHIGCLVHGCFNASIPKPFKLPMEVWQHIGVKVGDHLEFEVCRLDCDAVGVSCIRGFFDRTLEAQALERLNKAAEEKDTEMSTENTANSPEDADEAAANEPTEIPEEPPAERKAKKRHIQETLPENVTGMSEGWSATSEEEIPKKKKKKKRLQEPDAQPDTVEVDASMENSFMDNTILESPSISTDHPSKKSRKKKAKDSLPSTDSDSNVQTEARGFSSLENDSLAQEEPKKPKKKKHKGHLSEGGLDHSLQNGSDPHQESTDGVTALSEPPIIQEIPKKKKNKRRSEAPESTNGGASSLSEESQFEPNLHEMPKEKKHKRRSEVPHLEHTNVASSTLSDESYLEPSVMVTPKEKKHKRRSEAPVPLLEFNNVDTPPLSEPNIHKKKKHKQRLEAADPHLESTLSEGSPLPSPSMQDIPKKKKHKRLSEALDPPLESSIVETPSLSEESPLLETSKPKKHKKKHHHVLPESHHGAAQTEDSLAGQEFVQPKAKNKRKE